MAQVHDPNYNPYAAPTSQDYAEPGRGAGGYVGYAGFWRRFVAYFIDNFILQIVGIMVMMIAGFVINATRNNNPNLEGGIAVFALFVNFVIAVAYFAGMESSDSQATLGKMAMGIKVTDLYGRRISFGRATGRFFGKILSSIILGIGFLMAAFTEKKQALHDMMSDTLVLKTR